jgi:exodeoxyribonuclease V beta subunit
MTPISLNPLTFPFSSASLIEASAGTGKTYTLAALYVRLVLGHGGDHAFNRALLPPEILVVTFTNAATLELRDRIRSNLSTTARVFRGLEDSEDPFTCSLKQSYPKEDWEGCALKLEKAADWMDEAAIFTIHGWAQRMLTAHAFDSNTLFDLQLGDDGLSQLEEACRDYWRVHCSVLEPRVSDQIGAILKSPEALYSWIHRTLSSDAKLHWKGEPLNNAIDPREIAQLINKWLDGLERCSKKLLAIWRDHVDEIESSLRDKFEAKHFNGKSVKEPGFSEQLSLMRAWAVEGVVPDNPQSLIQYLCFNGKLNKNKPLPDHAAVDFLAAYTERLQNRPVLEPILRHAFEWVSHRFAALKQSSGSLDFDDLLILLERGLKGPQGANLASRIRAQYPVAMIDEFQDTDPLQFSIFSTLYRNSENSAWIMIGDPKQAIYSFRGADIHTYLNAREDSRDQLYTLGTNFRSSVSVIEAVNELFVEADQKEQGAFLYRDASGVNHLPFYPVEPNGLKGHLTLNDQVLDGLHLMSLDDGECFNKARYHQALGHHTASRIAVLLNRSDKGDLSVGDDSIQPGDIAVLVRNFTEAKVIRAALDQSGIPSVYLSDKESVFESQEAEDLWRILNAVAKPRSKSLIMAALASPTLCFTRDQLSDLNQTESNWVDISQRFVELHWIWKRSNVAAVIRALITQFDLPSKLKVLRAQRVERSLTNLLHLAELLQKQVSIVDGELGIIRYLGEQIVNPTGSSEAQLVRMESDSGRVQVITMHKSKGLEYPVVFIPFGVSSQTVKVSDKGLTYRVNGQKIQELNKETQKQEKPFSEKEVLEEEIRLMYVALTRAKYACWIGVGAVEGFEKSAMASLLGVTQSLSKKTSKEDLYTSLSQAVLSLTSKDSIFLEMVSDDVEIKHNNSKDSFSPECLRLSDAVHRESWWMSSYSAIASRTQTGAVDSRAEENLLDHSIAEATVPDHLLQFDQAKPGTIHAFERGAMPGNYLHEVLERAAEQGFASTAYDSELIHSAVSIDQQPSRWHQSGLLIEHWLESMLCTPINLGFDLTLAELTHYQAEMEFIFSVDHLSVAELDRLCIESIYPELERPKLEEQTINGLLKGFIDLTFALNGQYWVCDYKSNWLGPDASFYTEAKMKEALVEHRYDLQLMIYLLALHRQLLARDVDYRENPAKGFDEKVGGAVYLYLRGVPEREGCLAIKPTFDQIERLDTLFKQGGDRATS